jgi:hypothetical protein
MATKSDFTDEEWAKIASLPGLVIGGAAWADGKMMPAVREIVAGGEVFAKAGSTAPEGSLVRDVFDGASKQKLDLGEAKPESTQAAVELISGQIGEAFALLASKASSDEVAAVRSTLQDAAKATVERLGSGFWGSGDAKVSEGEQAFLDRLAAVLNP